MKNKWFTIKKITPDIWGIGEFNHFEKVVSYLIVGHRQAILFDTGLGIENICIQIKSITSLPIIVINSHSHYDHIGGNKYFRDIYKPKNNELIRVEPYVFKTLSTPGHTPDSICLYDKTDGYLLTGDTLYPGPIYLYLKESDPSEYKISLKKLVKLKKLTAILPGHNDFCCQASTIIGINNKLENLNLFRLPKKLVIDDKTSLLFKAPK